jgi:hypothetical protein
LTFFEVFFVIETVFPTTAASQDPMLRVSNDHLDVSILDPDRDRPLLGPRYCAGCSIRQVSTAGNVPLLSGPEYPATPSVINGQGAPEVFQHTLLDDPEAIPEAKLIIGVGLVENSARLRNRDSHWTSEVLEPCRWSVREASAALTMDTEQRHESWHIRLRRSLQLEGTTLHSTTRIENAGRAPLPFRWFAHPFFPVHRDLRLYMQNLRGAFPSNPAFPRLDDGAIGLENDYRWAEGFFLDLPEHTGVPFIARLQIPGHSPVEMQGSFPLLKLALWANDRTFSPEPFFGSTLSAGSAEQWTVSYTFNNSRTL